MKVGNKDSDEPIGDMREMDESASDGAEVNELKGMSVEELKDLITKATNQIEKLGNKE